jgi:transposase
MAYDEKHFEKVAKMYRKCKGSTSLMQNHYPSVSVRTVQRWVKTCREMGLLDA